MEDLRPINLVLITPENCWVHIYGNFEYKDDKIVDFHGTISFGGSGNCPTGRFDFPVIDQGNDPNPPGPEPGPIPEPHLTADKPRKNLKKK